MRQIGALFGRATLGVKGNLALGPLAPPPPRLTVPPRRPA